MTKRKTPLVELIIFAFIIIIFLFTGYYFYWEFLKQNTILGWQYFVFSIIFSISVVVFILFFRRSLLSLNREIEEKIKLQDRYLTQLNRINEGILKALTYALDCRDHETWGHSARVVGYALAIGEKMGLGDEELRELAWGGFLHDIGKIGVPDSILLKKSQLDPEEWEAIKHHPEVGHDIVNQIGNHLQFSKTVSDIVLYHHERFDGKGYPCGLKGEEITLPARIFALADAMDAMTSDRPYRRGRSIEEALSEVEKLAGEQFCPSCVRALKSLGLEELYKIQQQVREMSDVVRIRENSSPFYVIK